MALIDRVKERTGTLLGDAELGAMIAAVTAEIETRYGRLAQLEVTLGDPADQSRWQRTLRLPRPLDPEESLVVVEIDPSNSGEAADERTLTNADYRVLHGGRTLQRLIGGPNGHDYWAPMVRVTYTPAGDQAARDELVIKLLTLDLSYRGLIKTESAGDYSWSGSVSSESYTAERERLMASLSAGNSITMA